MAKIDTINKYADAYLAGKSDKAIERFREKSVDKQYQSIMTWRYNMRKRGGEPSMAQEAREMVEDLRGVRRRIDRCKELDERILDEVERELNALAEHIRQTRHRLRVAEIEQLESRQAEIDNRLRHLREQVDPNQY